MSESNTATATTTETKETEAGKKKPSPKEERSEVKERKREEKALRSEFVGKEIVLADTERVMWSTKITTSGTGLFLTHAKGPEGRPQNSAKIPESISYRELKLIDRAVAEGTLVMKKDISKGQKEIIDGIQEQDLNDEAVIQEMSTIDDLLHRTVDGLIKGVESLIKEKKADDRFLNLLLTEEEKGRKREDYLKAIRKFV